MKALLKTIIEMLALSTVVAKSTHAWNAPYDTNDNSAITTPPMTEPLENIVDSIRSRNYFHSILASDAYTNKKNNRNAPDNIAFTQLQSKLNSAWDTSFNEWKNKAYIPYLNLLRLESPYDKTIMNLRLIVEKSRPLHLAEANAQCLNPELRCSLPDSATLFSALQYADLQQYTDLICRYRKDIIKDNQKELEKTKQGIRLFFGLINVVVWSAGVFILVKAAENGDLNECKITLMTRLFNINKAVYRLRYTLAEIALKKGYGNIVDLLFKNGISGVNTIELANIAPSNKLLKKLIKYISEEAIEAIQELDLKQNLKAFYFNEPLIGSLIKTLNKQNSPLCQNPELLTLIVDYLRPVSSLSSTREDVKTALTKRAAPYLIIKPEKPSLVYFDSNFCAEPKKPVASSLTSSPA